MVKVDVGVKMPKRGRKRSAVFKFLFVDMDIEGSFFLPLVPGHFTPAAGRASSYAQILGKTVRYQAKRFEELLRPGFKVSVFEMSEDLDGETGLRVWRIS